MKIIKYFSAKDFKNYMKTLGYVTYEYNRDPSAIERLMHDDIAVISIGNTEKEEVLSNNIDLWANGVNNHWLPDGVNNVLNINFGDVDNSGAMKYASALTEKQAKDIVNFIKHNHNKSTWLIHCGAGISRSGAVAAFLCDYFRFNDCEYKILPQFPATPNHWVLSNLHKLM